MSDFTRTILEASADPRKRQTRGRQHVKPVLFQSLKRFDLLYSLYLVNISSNKVHKNLNMRKLVLLIVNVEYNGKLRPCLNNYKT